MRLAGINRHRRHWPRAAGGMLLCACGTHVQACCNNAPLLHHWSSCCADLPAPPRLSALKQLRARRWLVQCPTAAACTLCPRLAACWRPGGRTTRGEPSWGSPATPPGCVAGRGWGAGLRACLQAQPVAWLPAAFEVPLLPILATLCSVCAQGQQGNSWPAAAGAAQAHIVRAMLEAICFQTRDVLEAMQAGFSACLALR